MPASRTRPASSKPGVSSSGVRSITWRKPLAWSVATSEASSRPEDTTPGTGETALPTSGTGWLEEGAAHAATGKASDTASTRESRGWRAVTMKQLRGRVGNDESMADVYKG